MPKRFSMVTVGETDLFYKGYVDEDDLYDSDEFLLALSKFWPDEVQNVVVEHCLYMDCPGENEDIDDEDLDDVIDLFDEFLEEEVLYSEERIEFEAEGLRDEEIERMEMEEEEGMNAEIVEETL